MASTAVQGFRRVVEAWPALIEKDVKAYLIKVAKDANVKIVADANARGLSPTVEQYANRPGNTNLDSVVLPGPIVFKYKYATDIVEDALLQLQKASPVRSGLYAKSHTIYVNGTEVGRAPKTLKRGEEVIITNPVPYARRLEVGKTESGRDFVIQVPPRIYERVSKILIRKYKNVADISFGYANIPGGYTVKGRLPVNYLGKSGARTVPKKRRQVVGSKVSAPALFIKAL